MLYLKISKWLQQLKVSLSLFNLLKNVDFINHIEGIDKGSGKLLKEW